MRDVIVVGAGGGGAVIAKELAERGLDVLLLEAGTRFGDVEHEWSHFESDANDPSSGYFRFGPADRSKPPWVRDIASSMLLVQLAGVGGTTNHYQGNSPRAAPGAFAGYSGVDANRFDREHLFPFRYRDLVPYYEWVEATLPVQTAPLGLKEEVFFDGARKLGLPLETTKDITKTAFRPQQNAILQPGGVAGKTSDPAKIAFPQARGCTFCGHCSQGCYMPPRAPINLKAKRSTSVSYIPMALTCDLWSRGRPVTLVTDAFAVRVGLDGDGTARSLTWRVGATGEFVTDEGRAIVLSAGTVETPRLWLNSGLPNPNGWVGRGLTDHFVDLVSGIMPFDVGSSRGPGSNGRIDYPGIGMLEAIGVTPGLDAFLHAFSDAGIAGYYDNGLPESRGADTVGRLVGRSLKDAMANIDRLLYIDVFTDDDVEQQNGVSLSPAGVVPPDEHGPVARVEIHQRNRSPRTIANREFLVAQAVTLLRQLGSTRVHRINKPPFVIHSHSTMRMGTSADDSVLDRNAEARWVRRLFVADNSALANGIGGPNPTLTTQALATRTAESIFTRYFGGDPWVRRESPLSSIDDAVTRAIIARGL